MARAYSRRSPGATRSTSWPSGWPPSKARHGASAILRLGGSGSCRGALHNTTRLTARFLALFGPCADTYGGYSSAAASFTTPFVLGTNMAGIDPGTLQHARLILLWGAHIADCRLGSAWEARIREARQRGVEVVVIDPRCTASVRHLGTRWVPVRPGTDSALMMAVLYVLVQEGLVDLGFVDRYSIGFAELKSYVLGTSDGQAKTPDWAQAVCGTPAATIVELARLYGRSRPVAHPLHTPSGRVEIASQAYAAQTGFPAAPTCRMLPSDPHYPLRLVTPKPRLRIHSQGADIAWFLEQEPQVLWIHPLDAGPRGVADGALALITSPEGQVRVPARVSEAIMPGVVCLLEGVWPSFDEAGVDVAGSANVLTSSEPTEPSQGSRTHSVLVQVVAG